LIFLILFSSTHAVGKTCPDLKNLLIAWRHRLPNDFDPLSVWDDIFQWRSHMFTAITKNFHWAEQVTLASLHDRPWTAIKMSKIARKQDVSEVALLSLGKLTDCAMNIPDAFSKLREQILSYRNGSEIEKTGGLNLINTTNLEYFDPNQKGELIRLKAEFLDSLGGRTKATQAYCHAVQLCPSYAKTWTSWGALCSSLADFVERQGRVQAAEKSLDKDKASSNAKKIVQYLAQSMGCFLEAIQCDSSERSRAHIPRCLQMLSKDGLSSGLLCSTFEKHACKLPSWVWLTWTPQLLSSLCRIEARASKEILLGILSSYPQAIYFSLRSFYLERRDQDRSRSSGSKVVTSGVSQAEELMSSLRKSHPTLWISLESVLEELIVRFRPSYEEELLTTITALLQRADSQIEHQALGSGKESDEAAVRASFAKTLSRVSAKFFRSQTDTSSTNSNDERTRKSANFTLRYKEKFENDFSLVSSVVDKGENNKKTTLLEISSKLKKWKCILETQVALSSPKLPLLHVSPTLSAISNSTPDLWSGACIPSQSTSKGGREKDTEVPSIQSSTAESVTAATAAAVAASRAVALASAYEGCGGYYGGGCSSVEIPGQYSPNILHDGKPTPELNAKLIKFEAFVEISRQNDQFVRRISMVGSDGKSHQFLLQFAVPYWTRTDERTSQLHQIFGQCLRRNILSSRRNLWLKPTAVIPIAQRLRMTAEDKSNTSLNDICTEYCFRRGIDPSDATRLFQEECKREINVNKNPEEKENVKLKAYENVCKALPSDILILSMHKRFKSAEKYFYFQRSFTAQLALNSLLQYAFDVNERSPSKLMFNQSNGQVLCPDFRFSYSNQGYLDEQKAVPFRLTRNIVEFIGPQLMKGIFKPSLSSAASAICADGQNLQPALQLLSRDDIVAWYLSKSAQRDGAQRSTQDLERHLGDRVKKNVYLIQNRLRECAPLSDGDNKTKVPLDDSVDKLIAMATKPENLVSMPLSFRPWL
jgi:transformation/transcription domain-associated protein